MPELAEVEYFRKQWAVGLGEPTLSVKLRARKRVFRGTDTSGLARSIRGARLVSAEASGKQMLFGFCRDAWLGVHLGMTGKLRAASPRFEPDQHDHLVLYQPGRALVFTDPRQFGRIRFHHGSEPPEWWRGQPPAVVSTGFSLAWMGQFLRRHARLPIKAALLLQEGFPGIGNWMADEALWQSGLHPQSRAGELSGEELVALRRVLRLVCRTALRTVGRDYSDPPAQWLFHQRWERNGRCPKHKVSLCFATIGGRTTAWCARCQP